MADLMLMSEANGTWEYEIQEKEVKVKHKITKGLNEIPSSHIERLESDLGYQARVKKGVYKVLKGGKAITAKKASEKPIDDSKDLDEIKEAGKLVIYDLKKKHKDELKAKNDEYTTEYQKLTNARGEALRKVKDLEGENLKLTGEIANAKGGSDADKKILETEIDDLKSEADKVAKKNDADTLALMTENEKKVKTLEGEKGSLEKQVESLKSEVKKLKKG